VGSGVSTGVAVGVCVGLGVAVGVWVGSGVAVGVSVGIVVGVLVGAKVAVGTGVLVDSGVSVGKLGTLVASDPAVSLMVEAGALAAQAIKLAVRPTNKNRLNNLVDHFVNRFIPFLL